MLFLQQLGHQIKPQIDHIRLQNKITTTATKAMRQKISIDLHDSTIQPYIGLKLGLEALRRKIPEGAAIAAEVDELVIMAEESIAELRQYIGGLKSQIKSQLGVSLVTSILEVAKKYQLRHGIEVVVNADTKLKLSEHLSTEIYQLVCEGLSNIHRHTQSKKAEINLYDQNDQLVIEVINQDDSVQDFIHFKPRSMTERITNLGGTISVNHTAGDMTPEDNTPRGKTIVTAKIPLQINSGYSASFA
jgi:signal transduction histidine kinase